MSWNEAKQTRAAVLSRVSSRPKNDSILGTTGRPSVNVSKIRSNFELVSGSVDLDYLSHTCKTHQSALELILEGSTCVPIIDSGI
jgi:hypothetical protein